MSEAAQSQVFLEYPKPSLKTILLTSVSADLTHPAACPQHMLCLSQGSALQGEEQPGYSAVEKQPPSPTYGASSIPVHTAAWPPVSVHEELGYFLQAFLYSTFQTFRQNFACVVLCACQTTDR